MKTNWKSVKLMVVLLAIASTVQAVDILENFESYADTNALQQVWKERNPTVATLSLETTEAKDGTQSMVIDYNCHNTPYWSEACRIFTAAQDWSAYNTLNVWIKGYIGAVPGHDANQSQEDMYTVIYQAGDGYPNPVDHNQLSMLGKVHVYRATKIADWTLFRFNLGQSFEPMTNVRAIGIGVRPDSYGAGIVKIDAISLEEESYGGIINNFEGYADTNALRDSNDVREGNSVNQTMTLVLDVNDSNVLEGHKSLKFAFDNGIAPNWSKVMFALPKSIRYAWGPKTFNYGMNYNPLTVNFKVIDPEGRIQVVLIGTDYYPKATYHYPDEVNGPTYRVPAGDWIRWDINPQSVYDPNDPEELYTELDAIMRVEVQFIPIDYGTGLVYLDDIHVNNCADGADNPSPTGDLRADFNKDCVIDFMDYVAFAEHWRQTGCVAPDYCGGADFLIGPSGGTRNGKVDFADLAIVTYRWLECNMLFQGDCF